MKNDEKLEESWSTYLFLVELGRFPVQCLEDSSSAWKILPSTGQENTLKSSKCWTGKQPENLPSAGQENNIAQAKTDKWISFPSHFSSFFTI